MMPWWLWGLVSNISIAFVENINRSGGYGSFWTVLPHTFLFIAIAQYGLWASWSRAPTMMTAWAFFTVGNSLIRIVNTAVFVKEPINWMTITGVVGMFLCAYLVKMGG